MEKNSKFLYLESLRGFACLMVFFTHFGVFFLPYLVAGPRFLPWLVQHIKMDPANTPTFFWSEWFQTTPLQFLVSGQFAVSIFFILSGFVLTYKFVDKDFSQNHLAIVSAVIKRPLRLFPMCFISVVATILLVHNDLMWLMEWRIDQGIIDSNANPNVVWKWMDYTITPWFLIDHSFSGLINDVLWTLRIELIGSLYSFLFVLFFSRKNIRWVAYPLAIYWFMFSYFEFFIFGILLADIIKNKIVQIHKTPGPVKFLCLIIGIYLASFPSLADPSYLKDTIFYPLTFLPNFNTTGFNIAAIYSAVPIFFVVLSSRRLMSLLEIKPLIFMGKISFAFYVMHIIVIKSLGAFILLSLSDYSDPVRFSVAFVSVLSISIILSIAMTYLVDSPTIKATTQLGRFIHTLLSKLSAHLRGQRMVDHSSPRVGD